MLQHDHASTPFIEKKHPVVVVCDGLQSPANIGAIFRLCDAFGVLELIFNNPIDLSSNRLRRTARNTYTTVKHTSSTNILETISKFQQDGFTVITLEISEKSVSIATLSTLSKQKMVLIIGNERTGVSEEILNNTNLIVHIPMYGKNSSMNVAQATAIALYELTKH